MDWVDWQAEGSGRPHRWTQADWQAIEQWVNEPRRYSAVQLSRKLNPERQVELGGNVLDVWMWS